MIHPRKYEEYELGVLVIHAKHDQKLGLWVEVSVAPAKKDKGCGLEEGLGWWCIPERVKSMGSGCGLEVHLEIWGFFFWKDMQEAECIVLGWTAAWRAGFGFNYAGFKSQSYHLPAESSRIICITSKYFLNYTVAVITAPYTMSSYEDYSAWEG